MLSAHLDELIKYSFTLVPCCLRITDGFFTKTNKAKLMHFIMEEISKYAVYPKNAFQVEDGNAFNHVMKDLPLTFGDICMQILGQIIHKSSFIFS